jgi:elongation factor Ts
MAVITATMVKELREATGLGMMECKRALEEAGGDMKAASDLLRIKSGAKATKAAGRIASEGVVGAWIAGDEKLGALIEVNCETDFVAKNEDFRDFARKLARLVAEKNPGDVAALTGLALDGATVEAARQALVQKIGENISLRRFVRLAASGTLSSYLHGTRIGVLVAYTGGDEQLGKDIAMHIAASKPVSVSKDQVSPELLAKEREIYAAQAAESGKPANIIEKMVEGRIAKYLAEVTLLGQPFVKDPDTTVEKLLGTKGAHVSQFAIFVVGEGIEKKTADFAQEVMAVAGLK